MIRSPHLLEELNARDAREMGRALTLDRAFDRFWALWEEARTLNPDAGADWAHDVQCDVEMARTLHALDARPRTD